MIGHLYSGSFLKTAARFWKYKMMTTRVGTVRRPTLPLILAKDFGNIVKYGWHAPRFAERLYICPSSCWMSHKVFMPWQIHSGTVVSIWPYNDSDLYPAVESRTVDSKTDAARIVNSCIEHWENQVPWSETPVYQFIFEALKKDGHFSPAGVSSLEDLNRRYQDLDDLFKQARKDRCLNVTGRRNGKALRGEDSTMIHIAPDGRMIVAGMGLHRFSIALILNLPQMPAQIGVVSREAIPLMKAMRKEGHV